MYLTEQDYTFVVGEKALQIVTQAEPDNRRNAEAAAQEEISGYLRPKYDCSAIFNASGEERNSKIVQISCDIALYHLVCSQPAKMGFEIRKERYDNAIKWLEGVQRGQIIPDLPLATEQDGQVASGTQAIFGTARKHHNQW